MDSRYNYCGYVTDDWKTCREQAAREAACADRDRTPGN